MRAKPQHHKPYGLLKQLPIPERPWNSISMDIIETLLTSSGHDSILVIVNHLTKQGNFIPTTINCTSERIPCCYIHYARCQGTFNTEPPYHPTAMPAPKYVLPHCRHPLALLPSS